MISRCDIRKNVRISPHHVLWSKNENEKKDGGIHGKTLGARFGFYAPIFFFFSLSCLGISGFGANHTMLRTSPGPPMV
jgi:hypothetical protein